jgi:hypothetical protein
VKMVRSILVGSVCALHVAALAQKSAMMQPEGSGSQICPPCLHDQALSSLPATVEMVFAVNNAAKQRSSPAGQALVGMLEVSGTWTETMRAWEALARALDWTPERTFDELLGRRISLVARGLDAPGGPEWAVLSAVSESAERRLRDRLRAAPRGAVVGLSVLSIEDGSFQFVVAPCFDAAARGETGSVILLAPRRCEALLDELAPALRGGAAPQSPSGRPCDVVVVVKGERTLAVTATARDDGWDATIVCAQNVLLENPGAAHQIRAWGDSSFRELEKGSLFAMMSVAMREPAAFLPSGVAAWKKVLAELAGGADAESRRTAVFIRGTAPAGAASADGRAFATVRRVSAEGVAGPAPRGNLCVTVAAETRDAREAMVKGDLVMARFARLLMTAEEESAPGGPQVQLEILDEGPRTLRIGGSFSVHPDFETPVERAFGDAAVLSWSTVERPGRSAWWIASMSSAEGAGAREARALTGQEIGVAKKRLSIGMARPAALQRWIEAVQPGILGSMAGAQFIDSLRWDSWIRDDGRVEATINVRMVGGTR